MEHKRLDVLVMERADCSRSYSQEIIEGGQVYVDGVLRRKPGIKVPTDAEIKVEAPQMRYVGRGGYKLESAAESFDIGFGGLVCGDVGASTGGFTDCMLQRGAERVYAIDVGSNQLAEQLKKDRRVISIENMDVRNVVLPEKLDFAAVDVSFVSVLKVADSVFGLLKNNGRLVCLIKPQFEAGKGRVGKNGVVKDRKVHRQVLENVERGLADKGAHVLSVMESPVKGGDGNTEFLLYARVNTTLTVER